MFRINVIPKFALHKGIMSFIMDYVHAKQNIKTTFWKQ